MCEKDKMSVSKLVIYEKDSKPVGQSKQDSCSGPADGTVSPVGAVHTEGLPQPHSQLSPTPAQPLEQQLPGVG